MKLIAFPHLFGTGMCKVELQEIAAIVTVFCMSTQLYPAERQQPSGTGTVTETVFGQIIQKGIDRMGSESAVIFEHSLKIHKIYGRRALGPTQGFLHVGTEEYEFPFFIPYVTGIVVLPFPDTGII